MPPNTAAAVCRETVGMKSGWPLTSYITVAVLKADIWPAFDISSEAAAL